MSVQIQCKSSLNQKTERLIERLENTRGGRMGRPSLSPPLYLEEPIR